MPVSRRSGILIPFSLFLFLISATAMADFEFYTGMAIGRSKADVNAGNLSNRLSAMGYDVTKASIDGEDGGMRFLIGLRFTDTWGVEMGHVNLGDVRTNVTGNVPASQTGQFNQDVANVAPVLPRGLTLAAVARLGLDQFGVPGALGEHLSVALKLGMIDVDSYRVANGVRGPDAVDSSPYYGVTFGWDFSNSWRGIVGYEVMNLNDTSEYWSVGLEHRFGQAER